MPFYTSSWWIDWHCNCISRRHIYRDYVTCTFKQSWNWLCSWFKEKVPQNSLVEGVPEVHNTLYKQEVRRTTKRPYTFSHQLRYKNQVITAIACLPLDEYLQSPEADILEGGINCNNVRICLTPVQSSEWGCKITICATSGDKDTNTAGWLSWVRKCWSSSERQAFN
jgi:hypothetical protein